MTRVIDTDARDEREREEEEDDRLLDDEYDDEGAPPRRGGGWDDGEDEPIPPRPRGRLLRPLPLTLIAVAIVAAGFIGGVEAQKGSEGSGGAAGAPGGGFAALAEKAGGESGEKEGGKEASGEGESEGGLPSFGGASEAAASGTVTSVEGHTIYVKETDGTTVAVKVGDGATVTRDSNVAAKKIHPGDTVTVEGSKKGSTVTASSVSATESGVESTASFGAPTTGASEETSVESLFEE
jgi:hypothetical protein